MTNKKILIIGAMHKEIKDLISYFQCKKQDNLEDLYPFWKANKESPFELGVLQTHVGDTNAAISTTLALKNYKPDYVFKIGCVGGNSKGLHVGNTLLPLGFFHSSAWITRSNLDNSPTSDSSLWQSVFGDKPYQVNTENLGKQPYFFKPESKLIRKYRQFSEKEKLKLIPCYIGGGNLWFFDKILMKNVSATQIPGNNENQKWGADMESYAIAHTCSVFKIPFMGFYRISNSDYYEKPYIPDEVNKLFNLEFVKKINRFLEFLVL